MPLDQVRIDDKYALQEGRVFITGIQALLRVLLDQSRRDAAAGLKTAGFVSGYRGSPLGGLDQQAHAAQNFLEAREIIFREAINEDLGATAVWGTQQVNLLPGARYDGVFGMWYGKAPGVDRTGDAFRHANFAGTWPKGGVLAVAGDDHACKSSTLPSQSEYALMDLEMPILAPADVQDVVDYGLTGYALSRFSGLWVGLIAVADNMDSGATIEVGPHRGAVTLPEGLAMPPGGLGIRLYDQPMDKEMRLRQFRLPAALAFARANRLDRVTLAAPQPRLGIAAHGQAWTVLQEALSALGLTPAEAARLGISLYKVAMPWPLETEGMRNFATGLETLLIVENKRPLLEDQTRAALFDLPEQRRPRLLGKTGLDGEPLLSKLGALSVAEVARAIASLLPPGEHMARVHAYLGRVTAAAEAASELSTLVSRKPFFCSGCPHNQSTRLPEGSYALAGIGCHYMASFADPHTCLASHMGGEGMSWAGVAPFTDMPHIFANLGDGTYNHSGLLAIRAAVAMRLNITYKLLYNDAVAMTGGQHPENGFSVPQITRQLADEGVARIIVVADDLSRYRGVTGLAPGVTLRPREDLPAVQEELRATKGVTALVYDQVCATEKRRRRKRGKMPAAPRRVFINSLVCEGCGDCSEASHCVSVAPLETEFGRKRQIDQSTCNQDYSCLNGFCPSFVTYEAMEAPKPKTLSKAAPQAVPEPEIAPLEAVRNIIFTGIGGTGVTTIASILGMAAHVDGLNAGIVDMTGLAQKNGAVFSHVRLGPDRDQTVSGRVPAASADLVLACDALVADSPDALTLYSKSRTAVIANHDVAPTADFITDRDAKFDAQPLEEHLAAACASVEICPAGSLAAKELGDTVFANMVMLGFAWQKGRIPVSAAAIAHAIALNGVAKEANLQAFALGRLYAHDPSALKQDVPRPVTPETEGLDELIARREAELTAYQNPAYAKRYRDMIDRVRAAEGRLGAGEALTRAAAQQLFRLMAIKDEYEVARLYTDGRFAAAVPETMRGKPAKVWLSPPLLAPKDARGKPRKIAYGGWMLNGIFPLLARLKPLRGTPLDIFGKTQERRRERDLLARYESALTEIVNGLSLKRLPQAVAIASAPADVRGFGHVREAAMARFAPRFTSLLEAWRRPENEAPTGLAKAQSDPMMENAR